jgi:tetratricopeptide (TPR) repeat protein
MLDEALADFKQASNLNEDDAEAYAAAGMIQVELGHYSSAMVSLNKAISIDESLAFAYWDRAMVHEEQGDIEAALADYETFLRLYDEKDELQEFAEESVEYLEGLLTPTPTPTPSIPSSLTVEGRSCITWEEARRHVGEYTCVYGIVMCTTT